MDTGLGRDGYSMIGQGKIDEILSTKSEDRRQLFEEAAGITKYKYRKTEAERKLASTEDNLTRLRDIISEIEANLAPLEQQSAKAKKFLDLREELKILELNVSVDSIDKLKKTLAEIDETFDIATNQLEAAKLEIEKIEQDTQAMFEALQENDSEAEASREREKEIEAAINACTNDINIFENDIAHNKENIDRISGEIAASREEIKFADTDYAEQEKILQSHSASLSESEQISATLQAKLDEITKLSEDKNAEVEGGQTDIIEKRSAVNSARAAITNLNILLSNYTDRGAVLDDEIIAKSSGVSEIESRISELETEIESQALVLRTVKENAAKLRADEAQARVEFDKLISMKNSLGAEASSKTSKKNMLEDMEKNFDGYTRSVKSLMQASERGQLSGVNVHAPISQLVSVDAKFATAIEVALGSTAQNVVVESESDAKRAIEYLKRNSLGRATFLPISAVRGNEMNAAEISRNAGFLGIASGLVRCDSKYDGVLKQLLGRIAVFEDIDSAIAAAKRSGYKFRIVTLTGESLGAGGAMTGGSLGKGSGFISRANEIAKLSSEIESLTAQIRENNSETARTGELANSIVGEISELNAQINSFEQQNVKNTADLGHLRENSQTLTQTIANLNAEKETILVQTAKINKDISEKDAEIANFEDMILAIEELTATASGEFAKISAQKAELNDKLIQQNIKHNGIFKDIEMQNERLASINSDKQELLAEIERKNEQIAEFAEKNEDLVDDVEFKRQQIEQSSEDKAALVTKIAELAAAKTQTDERIRAAQESSKVQREELFKAQNEHSRIENRKTRSELELEAVVNRMWEEYELTYSDALEYKRDVGSISAANRRIEELREEIRGLGNINIDAIEEYKSTRERFEFLTEQTADLSAAKADLEKIIHEMVLIMQEQFDAQFKVINEHFKQVFSELFGGGVASISLTDPSDILESGIEIEAQPPGKKLQNLTLLSGGERAFTAIALLFAILKTRPTPFCILDEIEAALDDVNVYRFADYLKKFSKNTQFIVVTHRRGTMEAASGLYGVTMQEKGVSKLLALDIDEIAV